MENKTKQKLQKKLKAKRGETSTETDDDELDLFKMLNDVNKILKENPEMVKKVSKCVSSVMDNKDLMATLTEQIVKNKVGEEEDQAQTSESNEE